MLAEKCEFCVPNILYLGYIISQEGVAMDKTKVAVVTEWLPQQLKSSNLSLASQKFYRQFIWDFNSISTPLTALFKKGQHLTWNQAADEAFSRLKTVFTTAPILKHPDPSKPFIAEKDASKSGVEAVLYQHFGKKPKLHPVTFYSMKLSPAEQHYDMGNHELQAITLALEQWHH